MKAITKEQELKALDEQLQRISSLACDERRYREELRIENENYAAVAYSHQCSLRADARDKNQPPGDPVPKSAMIGAGYLKRINDLERMIEEAVAERSMLLSMLEGLTFPPKMTGIREERLKLFIEYRYRKGYTIAGTISAMYEEKGKDYLISDDTANRYTKIVLEAVWEKEYGNERIS